MSKEAERSPVLLATARQSAILDRVLAYGSVRVSDLAKRFEVSEMTIRRDIDALAEQDGVEKTHGGAKLPGRLSLDESGFDTKFVQQAAEKQAIAKEAAKLVRPGMAIGVSAGTTAYTLAEELREIGELTIITNSVNVADVFYRRHARDPHRSGAVILTGGERTRSDALVGPIASSALRQLNLDLLFLGVHGADERAGLTTPNIRESEIDQEFIRIAGRVVVIADHTKWGIVGMSSIAPLESADVYVTDAQASSPAIASLRERVGELVIAGSSRAES